MGIFIGSASWRQLVEEFTDEVVMPYNPDIVVELGQVWYYDSPVGKVEYRISLIKDHGTYGEVFANKYREGRLISDKAFIGYTRRNGSPDLWNARWSCPAPRKFSRVNQKSLRKRVRDQMAAAVLTHRLTDERSKS